MEDLATIFDRIRILYKKHGDSGGQRKLITKNKHSDDLATQFDTRLSEVMARLSKVFKDPIMTMSHKHMEIDRAKFQLYEFCQTTCNKFLTQRR